MNVSLNCTCLLLVWLFISSASSIAYAQQSKRPLVCKTATLRALKAMPKLSYECDAQLNDWDEKILKLPARLSAIKTLESQLSSFTDPDWWAAGEDFSRKGAKAQSAAAFRWFSLRLCVRNISLPSRAGSACAQPQRPQLILCSIKLVAVTVADPVD
jgi:hypothetical protein